MKIIDAHMHYYNVDGFVQVAANAGYENTAACWQKMRWNRTECFWQCACTVSKRSCMMRKCWHIL